MRLAWAVDGRVGLSCREGAGTPRGGDCGWRSSPLAGLGRRADEPVAEAEADVCCCSCCCCCCCNSTPRNDTPSLVPVPGRSPFPLPLPLPCPNACVAADELERLDSTESFLCLVPAIPCPAPIPACIPPNPPNPCALPSPIPCPFSSLPKLSLSLSFDFDVFSLLTTNRDLLTALPLPFAQSFYKVFRNKSLFDPILLPLLFRVL